VLRLTLLAKHDIGLNIDAEEADRLELSLDLLERLCHEPTLAGWNGIGFVIQAYQKRCPFVIDYVVDLARRTQRRLMVRLVKGAYWDSEIKRAQVDGLEGLPRLHPQGAHRHGLHRLRPKLLAAPEAIYPQFATHNAQTLATIYQMAGSNYYAGQYEFQCLHGMGEPLYEQVVGAITAGKLGREAGKGGLGRPCRIYAPVGTHETLLAYLVRRLLENGANTSFVNRIADETIALDELVKSPVQVVDQQGRHRRHRWPAPPAHSAAAALYGAPPHQLARAGPVERKHADRLAATLQATAWQPGRQCPCWPLTPLQAPPSPCATPPTTATWWARCKRPPSPTWTRPWPTHRPPQPPGPPRPPPSAPPPCCAPPTCWKRACSPCWAC
jgi:RHH-type proline utilization regulon transcriptional repressor/proline dehydrogenase/delta 1-pyrroline-5-carboxylate dehydrogenase